MKELKVLKLTDVQGTSENFYSQQFELFLEENGVDHISETVFFITDRNTIVDIENDINEEDFKNTIKAGAQIKTMFFAEDNNFGNHINMEVFENLNCEGVEYGEEHGVLFDDIEEAEEYERKLDKVQKIEEVLSKDEIMDIIDKLDMREIVEDMYSNHFYASRGVALYVDLRDGEVFRDDDEGYTSDFICKLTEISLMTDLAEEYVMGIKEGNTKVVKDEKEKQEYLIEADREEEFERIITEAEEKEEVLEGMLEELVIDTTEIEEFYKI